MVIKRIAINIILVAIFIFLSTILSVSFVAGMQFDLATDLAAGYLWQDAAIRFNNAIILCPFNAKYLAAYADFLMLLSKSKEDNILSLNEAKLLYARALNLDCGNAGYAFGLAKAKLVLFLKNKNNTGINEAVSDFKRALKNDPNGFNAAYKFGNDLMEVWGYLDPQTQDLVIGRLKFVLLQKRWFWESIYPWAWYNTKDFKILKQIAPDNIKAQQDLLYFIQASNLYQFRREQAAHIDSMIKNAHPQDFTRQNNQKQKEVQDLRDKAIGNNLAKDQIENEDWSGFSADKINKYENGNMYWAGTISAVLNVPEGESALLIQVKGSPAGGIHPYMIVELEGQELGETFVNNVDWKDYLFKVKSDGGPEVLSIIYCNDGANALKGQDRNLYIAQAKIIRNDR